MHVMRCRDHIEYFIFKLEKKITPSERTMTYSDISGKTGSFDHQVVTGLVRRLIQFLLNNMQLRVSSVPNYFRNYGQQHESPKLLIFLTITNNYILKDFSVDFSPFSFYT